MKRRLVNLLLIIGFFSSCANNARTVYLKTDQVEGLTTEAIVTLNGFQIGQVDDIDINQKGEIIIKLNLDKEPPIPTDSKFELENGDLFGSKAISVELGTAKKMIAAGDTLASASGVGPRTFQSDSLAIKIKDIFENLTGAKQRDSILLELRRLNKNLEELKSNR